MTESTDRLEELIGQVQRCVSEQDWDGLSELDERTRETVLEVREQAQQGAVDPAYATGQIERLKALYDQAGEEARDFRDETAKTIRETTRNQHAARAYQKNQ